MNSLVSVGLLVFLLALIFLSIKYVKYAGVRDFLIASNSTVPPIILGIGYFATQYSMSMFMSQPGVISDAGYAGMSISLPGAAFTFIIPILLVGLKIISINKDRKFVTMSDYFSNRFDNKLLSYLLSLSIIIFVIPAAAVQLIGLGVILNTYTGLPTMLCSIGIGILVIAYCMIGGIRSVLWGDLAQGILMLFTSVAIFVTSIAAQGGLEAINQTLLNLNKEFLTYPGADEKYTWSVYFSMILMWSLFSIGQPHLFTKFYLVNDMKALSKAAMYGTVGVVISAICVEWAGVNLIPYGLENGIDKESLIVSFAINNTGILISSILLTGIASAGLSTVSSQIIAVSSCIIKDFLKLETQKKGVLLSKTIIGIVGVAAICIAAIRPALMFNIVLFAFGGLGLWGVLLILSLYCKNLNSKAVTLSIIVAELSYFLQLTFNFNTHGFNPVIISSLILLVTLGISNTIWNNYGKLLCRKC